MIYSSNKYKRLNKNIKYKKESYFRGSACLFMILLSMTRLRICGSQGGMGQKVYPSRLTLLYRKTQI